MPLFSSLGAGNVQTTNKGKERGWYRARIITHGYVGGGYKDSSPWRNVNRTIHSTDATTDLGDMINEAAAYCDGANSDNYFYVWGVTNAYPGTSSAGWSLNMNTSAGRGAGNSMTVARADFGTMVDYEHAGANIFIVGGGSNVTNKFQMKTESMGTSSNSGTAVDYTAACEGRLRGWHRTGTAAAQSFQWSTESYASWSGHPGSDGWGKAMSSYNGVAYMKDGGNLNTTLKKFNDNTGVNVSSFTVQDAGEENYQTGNKKGYCLGHYNTAQNNNTYKVNFTTDGYTTLGSASEPKGHAGMSSAALASSYTFNNISYGYTVPSY